MEKYYGIALIIVGVILLIAVLIRPVVNGILKEVRAYHKAETKDVMDSLQQLIGGFAATMLMIMNGGKNPFDAENGKLSVLKGGKDNNGD